MTSAHDPDGVAARLDALLDGDLDTAAGMFDPADPGPGLAGLGLYLTGLCSSLGVQLLNERAGLEVHRAWRQCPPDVLAAAEASYARAYDQLFEVRLMLLETVDEENTRARWIAASSSRPWDPLQ